MNRVASLILFAWLSNHMMMPANRPVPFCGRAPSVQGNLLI